MEFGLLGHLEARTEAGRVELRGSRSRVLLAMLLLHANQPVPVERLIDALWEDHPPARAKQTVQYFVHQLRRVLGDQAGRLSTHARGYRLEVEEGERDVDRFEAAVRRARGARAAGDMRGAARSLDEALAIWRGPAMGDLAGLAFAQPTIARLEELRLSAQEERAEVGLALGEHAKLVGELEGLARANPLRERLCAHLMLALYRSGRQADALAAYRACRERLVESQGLEPGLELRQLEQRILAQDPVLDLPPEVAASNGGIGTPPRAAEPSTGAALVEPAVPAVPSNPGPLAAPARPATPTPEAAGAQPDGPQAGREERRLATVLIVGLSDTTTRTLDPEDLRERHITTLREIQERIRRFGGQIRSSVGSITVALFGLPSAREDDPERAVRAGLAIRQIDRSLRIGIDTGPIIAVLPPEGDEDQSPVELHGAVLSSAGLLHSEASPGEVVVGAATYRSTERRIDYEPVDAKPGVWRPTAPRSRIASVIRVEDQQQAVPLVERQGERSLLAQLLRRVRVELEPQLTTLLGAPGIGKTRLLAELGWEAEADADLISWRQGYCQPLGDHGQPAAFGALAEIVGAHAGIASDDGTEAATVKLREAVSAVIVDPAEAAHVTAMLRPLLGLDPSQPGADQMLLDRRAETFSAWIRFLEAVAADRPLVLAIENLHWADPALLDFLDELVDRVGPVPLLVVCTARLELLDMRPRWGAGKRNAAQLTLSPLTTAGSRELLDLLLARDATILSPGVRRGVLERASGNPLYLEEYARLLRDRPPTTDAIPLPETVEQLITARIDALPPDDRVVLRNLAVLGAFRGGEVLADLSGLDVEQVEAALTRLAARQFVRRGRLTPGVDGVGYVFQHVLIQEVAYQQLLRGERASKHQRVAAWLEARYPEHAADRTELLAHHYAQALTLAHAAGEAVDGLADRARLVLRSAGDRAAELGAYSTAARFYSQALDAWPKDSPERPELLFRLGEARIYGEHKGEDVLILARDAFEETGRLDRAVAVEALLGLQARARGDAEAAERHLERAFARDVEPSPHTATALATRALDLMITDDYDQALETGRKALDMAQKLGVRQAEALALQAIGCVRLKRGDAAGAEDMLQAVELFEVEHSPGIHYCRFDLAWGLWWLGDLNCCAEVAATGQERAAAANAVTARWFDAVSAGLDYAAGRWDAALGLLDAALRQEASEQDGYVEPWYRILRARIRLGQGDLDASLADADAALDAAAKARDLRYQQVAMALRARALLAAGREDEAAAGLDELLALQRGQPAVACATPELAALLIDLGRPAGALPDGLQPTRWHDAVGALAARDHLRAAEGFAALGSAVDEALARVHAARQLAGEGRPALARTQLGWAITCYDEAGASAYREAAEALLAGLDRSG